MGKVCVVFLSIYYLSHVHWFYVNFLPHCFNLYHTYYISTLLFHTKYILVTLFIVTPFPTLYSLKWFDIWKKEMDEKDVYGRERERERERERVWGEWVKDISEQSWVTKNKYVILLLRARKNRHHNILAGRVNIAWWFTCKRKIFECWTF